MFAVMASNIHWRWTPNGYVVAAIGGVIAYILTVGLDQLLTLLRERSSRHRAGKH